MSDLFELPCGCHTESQVINGVNTMVLIACPLGEKCEWVKYIIDESKKQGNVVHIEDIS